MEKLNVDQMFRCYNCDYMVDEPHESECCGKLYCQSCVVELNFALCRICHNSIKFRKNLFAKNLLQKVELKCRHHCGGKFKYEDMKLHLYRCQCRIFKCTIELCTFVGRKFELMPHMIENHKIHLLTMMENFEDYKETIEKILKNPIDNRAPERKPSLESIDFINNSNILFGLNDIEGWREISGLRRNNTTTNNNRVNEYFTSINSENPIDYLTSLNLLRNQEANESRPNYYSNIYDRLNLNNNNNNANNDLFNIYSNEQKDDNDFVPYRSYLDGPTWKNLNNRNLNNANSDIINSSNNEDEIEQNINVNLSDINEENSRQNDRTIRSMDSERD